MKINTLRQYKNTVVLLIALLVCFVIAMWLMWVYEGKQDTVIQGLRWISAVVCIALFCYLCSSVYKQLRNQHRLLKMARKQKYALLSSLEEGVCWVDARGDISGNISHALPKLLGCDVAKGMSFYHMMAKVLDTDRVDEFIAQVQAFNVTDSDTQSLKPSETLLAIPITCMLDIDGCESSHRRYLNIHLHQIHTLSNRTALHQSSVIQRLFDATALMVVMVDVTDAVVAQRTLTHYQVDSNNTLEHVLALSAHDTEALKSYLKLAKTLLNELHEALRLAMHRPEIAKAVVRSALELIPKVHIKCAALGLNDEVTHAVQLEQSLIDLAQQAFITQEGLILVLQALSLLQLKLSSSERLLATLEAWAAKQHGSFKR
jgi:hypothetical protein